MSPANLDRLRSIKTLPQLVAYLRDVLDWPIESEDADAITFDYEPSELGLDADFSARIKEIKQLRPLSSRQPWGIFFINFEKKRLPVTAMRRILRALALRKRASANKAERQAWQTEDLLFISAYGEDSDRALTFAHFVDRPDLNLAELRVLGWDDDDTPLKLDYVVRTLAEKLRWSDDFADDPKLWRKQWSEAFRIRHGQVIRTSEELAGALAALARRLRGRIRSILRMEAGDGQIRTLQRAFQIGLIHDLDDDGFADMFAQTVTYGLFSVAARRTFPGIGTAVTKENVSDLVFTSPFLKDMLGVFLGIRSYKGKIDFDELGVSDVTDLLTSEDTDMEAVLRDFNNRTRGEDPVIHFYERFLSAYNKQLKIQRGVFYTPQPVVSYIVRSVHELLQTEFGLADGLADTTTWSEMLKKRPGLKLPPLTDEPDEKRTISPDEPFVQILDPATGTATFLVEVIDVIHRTLAAKWKQQRLTDARQLAAWNDYVPKHLLPRLHAFELMMAPYAIAHMKVGLKLAETGYRFSTEERARIYLTNALEPWVKQLPLIGFDALAHEAAAVNEIKRHKRFTVLIGNPPYAGESANPSEDSDGRPTFIGRLIRDYFWVDGEPLGERNSKWLHDDYAKFIRLSEFFIRQSGEGVLGYITNHSFIFNATFRGMRQHMLASFQRLDIANLHGSTKLKEQCPDGSADVNVFDIEPGVAITIGMRRAGRAHCLAYGDIWGSRESKYAKLNSSFPLSLVTQTHQAAKPFYLFFPQSSSLREEFMLGAPLVSIFPLNNTGIITKRDGLTIHPSADSVWKTVNEFAACPRNEAYARFDLPDDVRDWSVERAQRDLKSTGLSRDRICEIGYRPFDIRFSYYTGNARGFVGWPVEKVMKHMVSGQNLAMCIGRAGQVIDSGEWNIIFCTRHMTEFNLFRRGGNVVFPLYLKSDKFTKQRTLDTDGEGKPNLSAAFISRFQRRLKASPDAEHIFHYAYAVFHSPGYRSRYAEFLKIDFPRLPLTGNLELFRALAWIGGELTALHLLESPKLDKPITEFIGGRNPEVEKVSWSKNTVWVDKAQTKGFRGVREAVWNFHIGGYQVCEKWLKDRKGRTLSKDDIAHYHKIVVALTETIRLMAEVDQVIEKHGGWPGAFASATTEATASAPAPEDAPRKSPAADLGLHTDDELPLA